MVRKAAKLSESALTHFLSFEDNRRVLRAIRVSWSYHTRQRLFSTTISPLLFISHKLGVWLMSFYENIATGHCLASWRPTHLMFTGFFYKGHTFVCTYYWGSIACWAGDDGVASSKGPKMLPGRVERWEREAKPDWSRSRVGGASQLGYLTLCSIVAECVFQLVWPRKRWLSLLDTFALFNNRTIIVRSPQCLFHAVIL